MRVVGQKEKNMLVAAGSKLLDYLFFSEELLLFLLLFAIVSYSQVILRYLSIISVS